MGSTLLLQWIISTHFKQFNSNNSKATETVFATFNTVAYSLSFFMKRKDLLPSSTEVYNEIRQAFSELLVMVRDISLQYRTQSTDLSLKEITSATNKVFQRQISVFNPQQDLIIQKIWDHRLGDDAATFSILRRWLNTHNDLSQAFVSDNVAGDRYNFRSTSQWFQCSLTKFTRSGNRILAITGPVGCGKSFVALESATKASEQEIV